MSAIDALGIERRYGSTRVLEGLDITVEPVTRPESASPSVGTIKRHAEEQKSLLDAAFASPTARPASDY